ncbi:MAG: glycosyltransferase [Lachnospiraceae bacterium]|nr:glycosyltransferase [Lachnospiraceae bacterium]
MKNIQKAIRFMKKNGISNMIPAAMERLLQQKNETYQFHLPEESVLERQRQTIFKKNKLISIVVPAYETHPDYLRMLVDSVLAQTYPVWELIIADAGSTSKVSDVIQEYKDERIRYIGLDQNLGISGNTNQAIDFVKGEYTGLLDHDDVLTPDALFEVMQCIDQHEAVLVYSDEDKTDETGTLFYEPHKKMDFNLDLFLSNNYICHFTVIKSEVIKKMLLRPEYDGAQDYDLFLRIVAYIMDQTSEKGSSQANRLKEKICHIPKILYHWRCHSGSTAENPDSKQYAYDAGKAALEAFLENRNWKGVVEHTQHLGFYRIRYTDLFRQRPEVALAGGNGYFHGRVRFGAMNEDGSVLFESLPRKFSGTMHRAVLQQQVDALDVRNMISCEDDRVRALVSEAQSKLEYVLKNDVRDRAAGDKAAGDINARTQRYKKSDEVLIRQISLDLCRQIRQMGYVIIYDPIYHTGR